MSLPSFTPPTPRIEYRERDCERLVDESPKPDDERSPFEVDRARIIHSEAFRRLQGKTQVFAPGQSDFFRTRLTHSLEAAQIAKGLALRLTADPDLCEAGALAHDIGHPPFGHRGETVLQELMQTFGGFEANAQNLRVLCRIEEKFTDKSGLNLTRAVLDSFFKYKNPFDPQAKKFHYQGDEHADWLKQLGASERAFECQIVNLADDIAYAVHDFEDGIQAGLITHRRANDLRDEILADAARFNSAVQDSDVQWAIQQIIAVSDPPDLATPAVSAKRKTSELIHAFVQGTQRTVAEHPAAPSDRYLYRLITEPEVERRIAALKALSFRLIISDQRVSTLESRAAIILRMLFDHFRKQEAHYSYPSTYQAKFAAASSEEEQARVACDYIAGMTDEYAQRLYRRLFTAERSALHDF